MSKYYCVNISIDAYHIAKRVAQANGRTIVDTISDIVIRNGNQLPDFSISINRDKKKRQIVRVSNKAWLILKKLQYELLHCCVRTAINDLLSYLIIKYCQYETNNG